MEKLIPSSLSGRLFLVSMLVVMLFLPLAGLVLERAYGTSLDRRLQEQLKVQTYGLMGLADELEPGTLWLPEALPDARFNQIGSGRYAVVMDSQGNPIWQSQSAVNLQFPNPIPNVFGEMNIEDVNPPGQFIFERIKLENQPLLETSRVTVIWEGPDNSENVYTFMVAESLSAYMVEKLTFRDTLLFWLGGLGIFLLAVDAVALLIALKPLKQLAEEIRKVETGDIQLLETDFPTELKHVAQNLNTLITHEQQQRSRYRNTLQDLAHSLKTPLAVVQASLSKVDKPELQSTLSEQITRMSNIVSYQLQRAVSAGASPIQQKINVRSCLSKIFAALNKVYFEKKISFTNNVPENCLFYGDENDLLEMLGNLCDNACKYGQSKVQVDVHSSEQQNMISIAVIDDGEGVPDVLKAVIFQRGQRLDEQIEGQGIGLSVVHDIVNSYQGELEIKETPNGRNSVVLQLPGRF